MLDDCWHACAQDLGSLGLHLRCHFDLLVNCWLLPPSKLGVQKLDLLLGLLSSLLQFLDDALLLLNLSLKLAF